METATNLKSKNTPQLWIMLAANILIICGIIFPTYLNKAEHEYDINLIIRNLGATIAPLFLFLLNGLISSNQKAILVFWKIKNPLPGSEAFSKLSKKDSRIDLKRLKEIHGSLPKKPTEQNKLWYKIYKKHTSDLVISDSHRAYLLARDLTSLCFLFIVFIGLPSLFLTSYPINIFYFCYLVIQFLVTSIGAQNRGRRFVTNVLATEAKD